MLVLTACTPRPGSACEDGAGCDAMYVCASVPGNTLRRCLLPCAADPQNACGVGEVTPGLLCTDGSVCTDSDQGPVCLFAGRIAIGASCPDPDCDPSMRICACEPGTRCHEGVCRQVCNALPICEDTSTGTRMLCAVGETCTAGVCL